MFKTKPFTLKIAFYGLWFAALFTLTAWFSAKVYASTTSATEMRLKPIAKSEHSGLTASLNKITTDKAKTDVVSCIDLPSNADWLPQVVLYDDTTTTPMTELSLIDAKNPATSVASHRCYHFVFHKGLGGKQAKIVITKLQTTVPESLTQEMCKQAQEKIWKEYPNFTFSCDIGAQGIGYTIKKMPKDLDEAKAYSLIYDSLTETVTGPWEMSVPTP